MNNLSNLECNNKLLHSKKDKQNCERVMLKSKLCMTKCSEYILSFLSIHTLKLYKMVSVIIKISMLTHIKHHEKPMY
jgi:hypothetical protein